MNSDSSSGGMNAVRTFNNLFDRFFIPLLFVFLALYVATLALSSHVSGLPEPSLRVGVVWVIVYVLLVTDPRGGA